MNTNAQQQLQEVNSAISKILKGGQSYKIGTRSLTRADLSELYQMKKELESEIAEDNNNVIGRRMAAAYFDRR